MKRTKMLLISPNAEGLEDKLAYPPLGLLYVAANLNSRVWDPKIKIMTSDRFSEYNYPAYGISVHSIAVVKKVRALIANIRKHNPCAFIILGGAAAGMFKETKRLLVIRGEAERQLGIDTSNLDNIKFPARHLVPYKLIHYTGKVHHAKGASTTMIATRGCVYNCNFCDRVTFGRKFRKRSISNVIHEVMELKNKYGIEQIRFCDDCITLDRKWFLNLCVELYRADMKWTCMSRADLLDPEMLSLMQTAGCQEIFFGFESGSNRMLKAMNKRSTVDKYIKAIKMCRDAGIKSCAYILFGFPVENEESVEETIDFLDRAKPDKSSSIGQTDSTGCVEITM